MKRFRLKIFFLVLILIMSVFQKIQARTENCSTTVFYGNKSSQTLVFPPGGGYNKEAKVSLPMSAVIGATSVDLAPKKLIGTPYIWVPNSSGNTIFQIDTKTGDIVNSFGTGASPSRVTVMPGGDTWVANRNSNNLTRFSPVSLGVYSNNGTYSVGSGPRGLSFDYKGNIWAFDYGDKTFWKFTAPGYSSTSFTNNSAYPYIYGAIGDSYGYVWMVGDSSQGAGNRKINILNTKTNNITLATDFCSTGASNYLYGIGMDTQGNVVVANYGGGGYCKFGGAKSGASFGKNILTVLSAQGSRGIAVDGNNNVWLTNSSDKNVYVFDSSGVILKKIATGHSNVVGVAIDFDNNAWVISEGDGYVIKYGAVGSPTAYNVLIEKHLGGSLYNYSDMTGFRSTPTLLSVGDTEYTPTIGHTYTGFGAPINAILSKPTCSCVVDGFDLCEPDTSELDNCIVPLSLFSVIGGEYEAKNLSIECHKTFPAIIDGLVPCSRLDDNEATTDIDETKPCDLCSFAYMLKKIINFALLVSLSLAVLAIIVSGFLYTFSTGNIGLIEKAKNGFYYVMFGLVIIFLAWVIIAIILKGIGYADILNWNQVNCVLQKK